MITALSGGAEDGRNSLKLHLGEMASGPSRYFGYSRGIGLPIGGSCAVVVDWSVRGEALIQSNVC